MSEIKDFKDLIIWQKGMLIAEKCYQLTKSFPKALLYESVLRCDRLFSERCFYFYWESPLQ